MSVVSGGVTLHFSTRAFTHTQRLHLSERAGDSYAGIRHCAHVAVGPDHVRCLDFNVNTVVLRLASGEKHVYIIGGHWARFWMNGYTLYKGSDGHLHKIPLKMRHWTVQQWVDHHGGTYTALKMLHRKNGDQIITWAEAVKFAIREGVVLTPEEKSRLFGTMYSVAAELVNTCKKLDYPCWAMALPTMLYAKQKCYNTIKAGGSWSMILGKGVRGLARRAAKVAQYTRSWKVKPTHTW